MPADTPPRVNCPHCGKPVAWTQASAFKPFCSERCKLIDLGDWLLEKHAIPGEPVESVESDGAPRIPNTD
ncbi:MAG TPA: DNA gyrase inhibitor YacG [Gammaproteobacteria bacterium]|nr:DNA gyrase inhibitor YacG [Gammaproteobacteria bacterium]